MGFSNRGVLIFIEDEQTPVTGSEVGSKVALDVFSVEPTGIEGAPVTVGTTAVALTFTGVTRAIGIQASTDNSGTVWFGPATVDNTGANAYGELVAGQAVSIELDDASAALYVCASAAAQKVYKVAVT